MAQPAILMKLRAATADAHAALEADVDIFERARTPEGRLNLARAFHGLHAEVEGAAGPWLDEVADLDFSRRRRSPRIARDIEALGGSSAPVADGAAGSRGEALGLFYVAEGSSLGGRVVRDRLARDGVSLDGLGFLDPYGPETGDQWRRFIAVLAHEHQAGRAQEADILSGGVRGFETARAWLVPGKANG